MGWLWALTAFSAGTAVVTGAGWWITWYKLEQTVSLLNRAKASGVHQCPIHGGGYAGVEAADRAKDLHAIRERWEAPYRNRTD